MCARPAGLGRGIAFASDPGAPTVGSVCICPSAGRGRVAGLVRLFGLARKHMALVTGPSSTRHLHMNVIVAARVLRDAIHLGCVFSDLISLLSWCGDHNARWTTWCRALVDCLPRPDAKRAPFVFALALGVVALLALCG